MTYKVEGQHLFQQPPPNVRFNYDPEELRRDLENLMEKYKLTRLEVHK